MRRPRQYSSGVVNTVAGRTYTRAVDTDLRACLRALSTCAPVNSIARPETPRIVKHTSATLGRRHPAVCVPECVGIVGQADALADAPLSPRRPASVAVSASPCHLRLSRCFTYWIGEGQLVDCGASGGDSGGEGACVAGIWRGAAPSTHVPRSACTLPPYALREALTAGTVMSTTV